MPSLHRELLSHSLIRGDEDAAIFWEVVGHLVEK